MPADQPVHLADQDHTGVAHSHSRIQSSGMAGMMPGRDGARRLAGAVVPISDLSAQAAAGVTCGSCSNFGSQPRRFGRYQLRVPRSFIVAGSSTARTMVASIRIAAARPTPSCFIDWSPPVANIANVITITAAALVMIPAVLLMP